MDADTLLPVDIETYSMNLTNANKDDEAVWTKTFDYRKEYKLDDLSPRAFMKFADKILFDEVTAKQFRNHQRIGHSKGNDEPCDYECRKDYYCSVVQGDRSEHEFCMGRDKTNFVKE